MNSYKNKLNAIIKDFIVKKIDGSQFEEQYSAIYDFEEYKIDEDEKSYFENIRHLLEKFTPFTRDIHDFSDYFINENQLRIKILGLNKN